MSLRGLDAGRVHRANHREQHGQRPRVVADARRRQPRAVALDLDVGALGKHGVEVRGDRDERAAAGALAQAHDVAFGVPLDVGQAVLRAASRDRPRRARLP